MNVEYDITIPFVRVTLVPDFWSCLPDNETFRQATAERVGGKWYSKHTSLGETIETTRTTEEESD